MREQINQAFLRSAVAQLSSRILIPLENDYA